MIGILDEICIKCSEDKNEDKEVWGEGVRMRGLECTYMRMAVWL